MGHTPLGEVCLSLGLMRADDVDKVLARLRAGGRARFGEIAIELGFLDDDGLARALAHQFRLNMVPPERLARLSVAPDVLELLPRGLMRERLLVPTFLDEEKRVLSLLTADPTDIPSLRAAQTAARAARLRLFVAPRGAMRSLLERLLPPEELDEHTFDPPPMEGESDATANGITVVFEPDPERAAALRRLDATEGGTAEIVGDPEQVSAFVEANRADRVFFRTAVTGEVEPYLEAWRRRRPLMQICPLEGYGPGRRVGISYPRTRDFFFNLLGSLLAGGGPAADTARRTVELVRAMAEQAGLPPEQRDTAVFAALFLGLGEATERADASDAAAVVAWAMRQLRAWAPPYEVFPLLEALLVRVRGEAGPGEHVGAEIVFTARAAVQAALKPGDDPVVALGGDAARHDGVALHALASVLRRIGLREQVQRAAADSPPVVVLAPDASPLGEAARAQLSAEGYTVAAAGDAAEALRLARNLQAGALVTAPDAPGRDGIEDELRQEAAPIPLVPIEAPSEPALPGLLNALRKALRRRTEAPPAIAGRLSDLSLVELLQTLTLGGRTARVLVVGTAELGAVQVRDGRLVAATHGARSGEAALQTLVGTAEGRFEVRFEDAGVTNLTGASEFLLLEAVRRRDELRA